MGIWVLGCWGAELPRSTYRVPHDPEYGASEYEYKRGIATLLTVAREDAAGQIPGMRGGIWSEVLIGFRMILSMEPQNMNIKEGSPRSLQSLAKTWQDRSFFKFPV